MRRRRRTSRGRVTPSGVAAPSLSATVELGLALGEEGGDGVDVVACSARAGPGRRPRRRARRRAAARRRRRWPASTRRRRASDRRRGGRPSSAAAAASSAASTTRETMPHSSGLLGRERLAEKDQLARPGGPDCPYEGGRQPRVARQPDRRERRRQAGAGGGDAQVARQGQAEPGPHARPVDRRQHRLRHRRQRRDDRRVVLLDRGERRGRIRRRARRRARRGPGRRRRRGRRR